MSENTVKVKLYSYDHALLDATVKKLVSLAQSYKCKIVGPVPLPTKREIFTVCRSPRMDKRSMEHFERLTHNRYIVITANDNFMTSFRAFDVPAGVALEIK
ncbi:MAG: 30S ribosomal protein S10 [Mycoplasmataceae bacterium]|jgi:small subunit ribosomal protein S10|nr:30S ribosomal protein S10 [Mycoplasmataceae bacterium]